LNEVFVVTNECPIDVRCSWKRKQFDRVLLTSKWMSRMIRSNSAWNMDRWKIWSLKRIRSNMRQECWTKNRKMESPRIYPVTFAMVPLFDTWYHTNSNLRLSSVITTLSTEIGSWISGRRTDDSKRQFWHQKLCWWNPPCSFDPSVSSYPLSAIGQETLGCKVETRHHVQELTKLRYCLHRLIPKLDWLITDNHTLDLISSLMNCADFLALDLNFYLGECNSRRLVSLN
jgi:hypothetical protein